MVWLKNNNRHYHDITIDYDALGLLPEDDSIHVSLRLHDIDDEDEEESGYDDGPTVNTKSGALPDKANVHVSEGHASINPLL